MPGDLAITLQQASPDQQGLLASGMPRAVAALQRLLPSITCSRGQPPDPVTHW
ncbi:hypothetical protein ACET81_22155 [Aeromonas veronii]